MPIILSDGDIFKSGADILVNPVNCVGVMGKGLALAFKQRYPEDFVAYRAACDAGKLQPGAGLISAKHGQAIYHFPTKKHWRNPSRLRFIDIGLHHLETVAKDPMERSIAIPALGCGLGGLAWQDVEALITSKFENWTADVFVYPPKDR